MIAIEVTRREGGEESATPEGADEQHESGEFLDHLGAGDVASEIDWARTARFTFVGATVLAPALHFWYGFLIRRLPGTAPGTVVKRVLLDQLVFAPVFLAGFLSTVMVLDGNAAKVRGDRVLLLCSACFAWLLRGLVLSFFEINPFGCARASPVDIHFGCRLVDNLSSGSKIRECFPSTVDCVVVTAENGERPYATATRKKK